MTLYFLILFFVALIAGLAAFTLPAAKGNYYKLALVFAGSYLFSITILHILPELYATAENPTLIGAFVLGGFFLQQILEYFTEGAEHGHIHTHHDHHNHSLASGVLVLVALLIHSFMEGALLAHPSQSHPHHESWSLLTGIILHKAPAAFALMSILLCNMGKKTAVVFLIIFALGSPLGLFIGDFYVENSVAASGVFTVLFGIVSGNFLHISTTIVFESSVDHSFNLRKISVAMLGALIALLAEFVM